MINKLLDIAIDSGAYKAEIIAKDKIVLSPYFREVCASNQCGLYGKNWMCPPCIGEINELIEKVRSFSKGVLYQTVYEIEDSYDFEGMMEAGKKHEELTIEIQKAVKSYMNDEFLHLSGGGCKICDECAIHSNEPCRHPDLALPPMEGHGIDVYNTCKDTSLKYINGENTVTYFGLLLIKE